MHACNTVNGPPMLKPSQGMIQGLKCELVYALHFSLSHGFSVMAAGGEHDGVIKCSWGSNSVWEKGRWWGCILGGGEVGGGELPQKKTELERGRFQDMGIRNEGGWGTLHEFVRNSLTFTGHRSPNSYQGYSEVSMR